MVAEAARTKRRLAASSSTMRIFRPRRSWGPGSRAEPGGRYIMPRLYPGPGGRQALGSLAGCHSARIPDHAPFHPTPCSPSAPPGLFAGGLLITGPSGCGGGGGSFLTINANPDQVPADGKSTATVEVRAVFEKAAVSDGTSINLTVSGGSFDPTDNTLNTTTLSTTAGAATVKSVPAQTLGDYKISGSFTDDYGETHQAEAPVQVGGALPPFHGVASSSPAPSRTWACPRPAPARWMSLPALGQGRQRQRRIVTPTGSTSSPRPATSSSTPDTGALVWEVNPGDHPKDVPSRGPHGHRRAPVDREHRRHHPQPPGRHCHPGGLDHGQARRLPGRTPWRALRRRQ